MGLGTEGRKLYKYIIISKKQNKKRFLRRKQIENILVRTWATSIRCLWVLISIATIEISMGVYKN